LSLSIKTKLFLLLVVPIVLFIVAAVYLLNAFSSTVDRMSDRLYEHGSEIMQTMLNADRDLYQALTAYMSALLRQSDATARETAIASYQVNIHQTIDNVAVVKQLIEEGGLQDLKHEDNGLTLQELMQRIERGLVSWKSMAEAAIQDPAASAAQQAEMDELFDTTRGYIDMVEEVLDHYEQQTIKEEKDRVAMIAKSMNIGLGIEWFVLILLGIWLIRRITRALKLVGLKTRRISEGYLDLPESTRYSRDELGRIQQEVDSMIVRMRELIGEISNATQAVSAATGELSVGANESANASSLVARNIQEVTGLVEMQANITSETSKAIGEMTIGVQRIAESTSAIAVHAGDTNEQAQQGNELIMKLKQQMDTMAEEIARLGDTIAMLNEKSAQIGAITENITSFANQTGILSLNASIEAARAGEHGRGFAVVAGEIRKLAAHSLESANSINELISDTRREISNVNERMRATVTQVERSSALMQEVAAGFEAIAASIRSMTEQIHETSSVTEQMSASSQQVSASMDEAAAHVREVSAKAENVAAATEEQLALAENIARSADQMRSVVDNLNKAVSYFKI
jgi:methyl-accepting chemotaxis protein